MMSKINAETNPKYIYPYHKTKFVPSDGKVLLVMGQSKERITEYVDTYHDQQVPGGWTAYWGIPEFKGITDSYKNESGNTQDHQMLVDSFPNTAIHSSMWMVGKWKITIKTKNGDYNQVIKKYAKWAKAIKRPIYLRIGYEFDGPHNELEPNDYVEAYRHIVDLLRKKGVNNIAFVWHSYAAKPFNNYRLSQWYPGDDYVDWVGISVFGHAYNGKYFGPYCDAVIQFAKQHKKPVMIAESSPVDGISIDNIDVWSDWFVPFFNFIYHYNIKAICFINEDWQSLHIEGISHWKDARLQNNKKVAKAWFIETNKNRYLKQSVELYRQLGYTEK